MAAARETASGGSRGRRPRLRNRSGEGRGLPCVFGLAAQAGGCGGAGRRRSLRSLGACAGEGGCGNRRLHWAASLRSARAVHRDFGQKRKVGDTPSWGTRVRPPRSWDNRRRYQDGGRCAPPFPERRCHQPFIFGQKCFGRVLGGLDGLIFSYEGEHDGGRGMMHVHLGTVGKCSEFAATVVEDQA